MGKTLQTLSGELATRKRAIDFYSLGAFLPNPDPVLKKQGKDIAVYNDLLVDGHLGGCVVSRRAGVMSLEWSIDRGKARSRQARLIEDIFRDLDMPAVISEILKAPLFGFQVLEIIWERAGKNIVPASVVGKPQEWFVFSGEGELKLRTKDNWSGESLPEKKFLLARHEPTYKNPYGFPLLSRCFWPITFKRGAMKFWVTFSEKYGMPFLLGRHPRGTSETEAAALADMLEMMIQDAVAVVPDDSQIEVLDAGGKSASAAVYQGLIEMCKAEISISILGQNLTTEVKGGSYAAAETHMQVRRDIVDSDRRLVEKTISQLIAWIYELNFGAGEKPAFTMWGREDVDKVLAERDAILGNMGVRFSKKYFQKNYGLEEEDFEIAQPPAVFSEFAEARADIRAAQEEIDFLADNTLTEGAAQMQQGAGRRLERMVASAGSYADLQDKIKGAYGKLSMREVQKTLEQAMFLADLRGRSLQGG